MESSTIKCVIFDCDGTLVDSESLSCQALVQVFASYGADVSYDECMANFQGGKMFDILKQTSDKLGVSIPMETLEPKCRQYINQLFEKQLQPMPSAIETVESLIAQGISVCVASNGPVDKMEHSLRLINMLPMFKDNIYSAFDINSRKPAPDLLKYTAMQMGFLAEECLFIDDTETGVWAGVNANIKTLHFSPNQRATIEHPLVDHISDLSQIKQFIC